MATVGLVLIGIFGLLAIIGMLVLRHWERAKTGFLLWAVGVVGLIASMLSMPPRAASAVYKPSETCDESIAGTSSTTACGSSAVNPGSQKKRR
jgi:DMSO reductase anchor subunit